MNYNIIKYAEFDKETNQIIATIITDTSETTNQDNSNEVVTYMIDPSDMTKKVSDFLQNGTKKENMTDDYIYEHVLSLESKAHHRMIAIFENNDTEIFELLYDLGKI